MNTMTVDQFKNLVANGKWTRTQLVEIQEREPITVTDWDSGDEDTEVLAHGQVILESRYNGNPEGVAVEFFIQFSFIEGQPETLKLDESTANYQLIGGKILDESGDEVSNCVQFLTEDFSDIDLSDIVE